MPEVDRRTYYGALAIVLFAAALARIVYYTYGRLRFDAQTIDYYFQYVDPMLLKTDLLRSVLHLHSQPPLFNFVLGLVLKASPENYAIAFNVIYVALGIVMIVAMFHLMLRLGVRPWLAVVVTTFYAISPISVCYENWLYFTLPMATLLVLATLLLHRYATTQRFADAGGFFACLALIVLSRGYFNIVWFAVAGLTLIIGMRGVRRRTLLAMALPLPILLGMYVLNYVHFGTFNSGKGYQQFNLSMMTTARLPKPLRNDLIRRHKISGINRLSVYHQNIDDYLLYIVPPKKTGIPVLDQHYKSTGVINWHSLAFVSIFERYGEGAQYVLREYPETYKSAVAANLRTLLMPPSHSDPLYINPSRPGRMTPYKLSRMSAIIRWWDFIFSAQWRPGSWPWLNLLVFPAAILCGIVLFFRWVFASKSSPLADDAGRAEALAVAFMVYNYLYVAAVSILFSSGDHSRYRFKTTPLICILLALLLHRLLQLLSRRRKSALD